MPDFNYQQDDTGGILQAIFCLLFLIGFLVLIAWLSKHIQ